MKAALVIRIITLPPVIAGILVTLLFSLLPGSFGLLEYVLSLVFLVVLPLLGYPLQRFIPGFKDKGREGQRNLALIMSIIGYIAGFIVALCTNVSGILFIVYLTYLISGALLILFNKGFKIKASGHAGGFAGPLTVAICLLGPWYYIGLSILVLVFWASLVMKRHTLPQLIIGSFIPVAAFFVSCILAMPQVVGL